MKKRLASLLIILSIVLFSTGVFADTLYTLGRINNVYYDELEGTYMMSASFEDGSGWEILLIEEIYNKDIAIILNKRFGDKQVLIKYDDVDTVDIYDDIILKYYVLD